MGPLPALSVGAFGRHIISKPWWVSKVGIAAAHERCGNNLEVIWAGAGCVFIIECIWPALPCCGLKIFDWRIWEWALPGLWICPTERGDGLGIEGLPGQTDDAGDCIGKFGAREDEVKGDPTALSWLLCEVPCKNCETGEWEWNCDEPEGDAVGRNPCDGEGAWRGFIGELTPKIFPGDWSGTIDGDWAIWLTEETGTLWDDIPCDGGEANGKFPGELYDGWLLKSEVWGEVGVWGFDPCDVVICEKFLFLQF